MKKGGVLSTLLAWVVHNEVPSTWATAGSVVIVLGLILNAAQAAEPS